MKNNQPINLWLALLCLFLLGCQRSSEIPGVVIGSSMAPTLLGEHYLIQCDDCQFEMRFDIDRRTLLNPKVTCSHCGQPLDFENTIRQPAERVSIVPGRSVNRWDIIAFQIPGASTVGIKRVVGLPGECVSLNRGNLHVDGILQKKNWQQQLTTRILVHDNRFVPQSALPPRWSAVDGPFQNGWQMRDTAWFFDASRSGQAIANEDAVGGDAGWHWLTYQHWRGCRHGGERTVSFPVEDLDSFNQSLSRSLHPTADLFLEIEVQMSEQSVVGWRFFRGQNVLQVELDFAAKKIALTELTSDSMKSLDQGINQEARNDSSQSFYLDSLPVPSNRLQISTFDNQFLLAIDEQLLLTTDISDVEAGIEAERIVWMGAKRGTLQMDRIRIFRDIYYFNEDFSQTMVAEKDCFLVIGDNVPISTDSRHWQDGGIPRPAILGIVRP